MRAFLGIATWLGAILAILAAMGLANGRVPSVCPLLTDGTCWHPVVPSLVCPNGAVYAPFDGTRIKEICAMPNPLQHLQGED